jgi:hypothetical protein
LETFEEIIKEGRKFGVFLTVASQRPSDISPTIISQLHNYFIHKLMNELIPTEQNLYDAFNGFIISDDLKVFGKLLARSLLFNQVREIPGDIVECGVFKDFSGFMHDLTSLVVKPGALDLAGSLYKPGDYLLCHDDQVEDRKIAYILYLSKGFTDRDGASFMLFNSSKGEPSILAEKHLPLFNHLMVFEVSTISFHAVEENLSAKDRYAVGGWLH